VTAAIAKTANLSIDLDEDQNANTESQTTDNTVVSEDGAGASEVIDEDGDGLDDLPKRATTNDDGSVTLPLLFKRTLTTKKDGKIRDREFTELTFHRLAGADTRAIAAASAEMVTVVAFARSTRLNQAVMNALFDKMDAADITDAGRVLNNFLSSGRKTGR